MSLRLVAIPRWAPGTTWFKPHIFREHGVWKVRCKHRNTTGPYYTFEYAARAARAIWRQQG